VKNTIIKYTVVRKKKNMLFFGNAIVVEKKKNLKIKGGSK
jgi:hypothetical protein